MNKFYSIYFHNIITNRLKKVFAYLFIIFCFSSTIGFAQPSNCVDFGVGSGEDPYMFIDFFKTCGSWNVSKVGPNNGDTLNDRYKTHGMNGFKIVNNSYSYINLSPDSAHGNCNAIHYWDMMVDQKKILSSGYPVSLPVDIHPYKYKNVDPNQGLDLNKTITIGTFSRDINNIPEGAPFSGWILRWKGKGTFTMDGLSDVSMTSGTQSLRGASAGSGSTYAFSSDASGGGKATVSYNYFTHAFGRQLRIESSDASDPIRDIQFVYPTMESILDGGQNINPKFLEKVTQFKVVRYMDYMHANGVPERPFVPNTHPYHYSHFLKDMAWSERTTSDWYKVNATHEYIIEISNLTKTSPWVNIPYAAGQDYVENMAKFYMERLDPDLQLYTEVGNELWNWGGGGYNDDACTWQPGFNGFFYFEAYGAYYYPGIGGTPAASKKINNLYKWLTAAAGPNNKDRLVRNIGVWTGYYAFAESALSQLQPENWDAMAMTWYYSLSGDSSKSNGCKSPDGKNWRAWLYDWWVQNPNDQPGFNAKYQEAVLNQFRCSDVSTIKEQKRRATAYGKKLVTYEGGAGLIGGASNGPYGGPMPGEWTFDPAAKHPQNWTDNDFLYALIKADESSASAAIFEEIIDTLKANGVALVNHYGLDGRSTAYGVWNLFPQMNMKDAPSTLMSNYPKYKKYSEISQTQNCKELLVNLPTLTVGAGLAIKLDGNNDYVQADNISYKPDESGNYTIEGWVQPLVDSVKSYLFTFNNSNNAGDINGIYRREDGKIVWEIKAGASSVNLVGTAVQANKWYHIAATKSGSRFTLYINGTNVASMNATITTSAKNKFSIGALVNNSGIVNPFKGEIDEVRIWNTVRIESDIREYMCKKIPNANLPAELKAYLRFDDGASSVASANLAETAKPGTLQNVGFSERSGYTVSGAPIGDLSKYRYETVWTNVSLSSMHTDGDQVGVNNIGAGNPDGIHIYWVNQGPHFSAMPPLYEKMGKTKYFGVFAANGIDPTYDLTYMYQGNPDAGTGAEETKHRLLKRNDASVVSWVHSGAKLDKVSHTLNLFCKEKSRGEYDLGFRPDNGVVRPGSGIALQYKTPDADGYAGAKVYNLPDFTDYTITYWAKGWGQIYNLGNRSWEAYGGGSSVEEVGVWSPWPGAVAWAYRYNSDQVQSMGGGDNYGVFGDTATWYHYAITRRGTKVSLYLNGNLTEQTDLVGHHVYNMVSLLDPPNWHGETNVTIDEFTLWNTDLDQQTIRDWMCKKITGKHPYSCKNLQLYFNFDEGQGLTLEDKNGSSDVNMVPGYYKYVSSGAAIGDESAHDYVTPADITFAHPSGDYMEAKLTEGAPIGVQLYRVDNMAPVTPKSDDASIVSNDSTRYWGLYVCNPIDKKGKYDLTYYYAGNTTIKDETTLRLLDRFDNTIPLWSNPNTEVVSNPAKTIKIPSQPRGEYMLGGTSPGTFEYKVPAAPIFLAELLPKTNVKTICGNSTGLVYKIQKNPAAATYVWTVPDGLDGFSTSDSIVLSASYKGLSSTTVTLSVVAVNGAGKSSPATYTITINPEPTLADAGPDQMILPPATSALMDGNIVGANETGTWSIKKGNGTIALATDPKTNVTNLQNGKNVLVWTIKQNTGTCPASSDSVNIMVAPSPIGITQADGSQLPLYICGNTTLSVKATPPEGITPDKYVWDLPKDFTLVSQSGNNAIIKSNSTGVGGTIKVSAVYGSNNATSLPFESSYISIKSQPNKPVFETAPSALCYQVSTSLSAITDPTITSYEWNFPFGILQTTYPKSTSKDIVIKASQMVDGYITLRSFNEACSNSEAIDSFYVKVGNAPARPLVFSLSDGYPARRCIGDVIYSVQNPDPNVEYVWTWEEKIVSLNEYFEANHSSASFDMSKAPDGAGISVYAKTNGSGCNVSDPYNITSWPPDVVVPYYKPDPITISNPSGQDPTDLQVGQTYTLQASCSTCPPGNYDGQAIWQGNYFWDVPDGIEVVPDNNPFDDKLSIKVDKLVDAPVRLWAITLRGCAGVDDSLIVSTPGAVPAPLYVSGDTTICEGETLDITVKNVGADEYIWQLPDGSQAINTGTLNVLSRTISVGMKGNIIVKAKKGAFISEAAKIPIFVKSTVLPALTFYDGPGDKLTSLEACASNYWGQYMTVKISNNFANEYIWEIPGSVIQMEPRMAPFDVNRNGVIDTIDPSTGQPYASWDWRYEIARESPHTSGQDTIQYFTFQGWRLYTGITDGYIWITSRNGCGGPNRRDSLYYSYAVPAAQQQPVFVDAPTSVCAGSRITYSIKPIPNAVEYYWTVPSGLSAIDLSTTIPQITVDVGNGTGGQISVYARSKACDKGTTPLAYTENIKIEGKPIDFKFIDAPLAGCLGETLKFKISDAGVAQYNWKVPAGLGNDTVGGTSMDLLVKGKTSGSVCVSFPTDACPVPYMTCTDNINLTGEISEPTFAFQTNSVCPDKTYTYTSNDIGADSYTWVLPPGWKIGTQTGTVTGQGRSVQVTVGSALGSGTIGVSGQLKCANKTSGIVQTNAINFKTNCDSKLSTPVFALEPPDICEGTVVVYKVNSVPNAQTYEWYLPPGLAQDGTNITGTVFTPSDSILVRGTGAGKKGYIKVKAQSPVIAESLADSTSKPVSVNSSTSDISLSRSSQICEDSSVTLTSASSTGNQWYKNGQLLTGDTLQSYTANSAGSYNLIVTLASCVSDSSGRGKTISVSPKEPSTISADGATIICEESGVKLNTSSATSYQWYKDGQKITAGTQKDYTARSAGYYNVIFITALGCASDSSGKGQQVSVTAKSLSSITAQRSTNLCEGGSVTLTSGSTSGNQWYKDGVAISDSTNQHYTANSAGYYNVVFTSGAGCVSDSTGAGVAVNVSSKPRSSIIADGTTICKGDSIKLSSASASGNQWYRDGQLLTGDTLQNFMVHSSGNYNVIYTNGNCISDSTGASKIVSVTDKPVSAITAESDTIICEGSSVKLTSSSLTGNQWYKNGVAIPDSINQNYIANSPGTYNVVFTLGAGCVSDSSTSAKTVSVITKPISSILSTQIGFCAGDSIIISSEEASGNQWYKDGKIIAGEIRQTYKVKEAGYYNVVVSKGSCVSDTVGTGKKLNSLSANKNLTFTTADVCPGKDGSLTINGSENGVNYKVVVDNDTVGTGIGTGSSLNIGILSQYLKQDTNMVKVAASKGSCAAVSLEQTDTIVVRQLRTDLTVTGGEACYKGEGTVAISNSQNGVSYAAYINSAQVATGQGSGAALSLTVEAASLSLNGNTITIKASGFGCTEEILSDTAMIRVKAEIPKPGPIAGPEEICKGDEVVYSVAAEAGKTYVWGKPAVADTVPFASDPSESTLKLQFKDSIHGKDYVTVKVKEGNCYSDTSRLQVKTKPNCGEIFIPNIITPGTSDNNNAWTIQGIQNYPNADIKIMNRWGSVVYQSKGYNKLWDGNSKNNEPLPTGTYYYIIDLQNKSAINKKNTVYNGSVTIMR